MSIAAYSDYNAIRLQGVRFPFDPPWLGPIYVYRKKVIDSGAIELKLALDLQLDADDAFNAYAEAVSIYSRTKPSTP